MPGETSSQRQASPGIGRKPLAHRSHVGRELRLQGIEEHIGAQLDRLDGAGLAHQTGFAVGGDDTAGRRRMQLIKGCATAAESQVGAGDLHR